MNLTIGSIENSQYEAWVLEHGAWSLFQSWRWGELLTGGGNWVERLAVYDDKKLVATAQIQEVTARRGTFLQLRQGPIIGELTLENQQAVWQILVSSLKTMAKERHALFIRINPMIADSAETAQLLKHLGFRPAPIHAMDAEICWVLDISTTEEALLAGMRKTTRYEIRRGQKLGLTVEKSTDITQFMQLYEATASRQGFVTHQSVAAEFELFFAHNEAELLLARYQNEVLAGALIIYFGRQAIYHHGASISGKIPASALLQWEAIKRAKMRGATLYNFWGIAPPENENHPWKGLTLFKQGFGGEMKRFIHSHDLPLSKAYILPYTIERLRKLKKGY
jgi:lipid II:glycine glycyltransferase (peptidoglycan interpeptide bridge formation enzyme)